jgi:hypothetical protein
MKLFISCCLALVLILAGSPAEALEELVLYDDFQGTFVESLRGKPIDLNRWEPTGWEGDSLDLVREIRKKKLRLLNNTYAGKDTSVRVRFPDPKAVTAIMIKGKVKDLELIECAGDDRIRALRASGFFFNTGTIPSPVGSEGDVLASIHVERRGDSSDPPGVLRVVAFVFLCEDPGCMNGTVLEFEDLGAYKVGKMIRLLIQWDEVNNQLIFKRDKEPEFIYTYSGALNAGPANGPGKRLGVSSRVANCTGDPQPMAFVEALIKEVYVNESAAP